MDLDAITADTSIDKIFKSADVQEIISTTLNDINNTILARVQAITNCIKFPSFSSEIEGQQPLSRKANSISADYSNFLSELTSYFATIDSVSTNREYEELITLESRINEEIEKLQGKIDEGNEWLGTLENTNYPGKDEQVAKIKEDILKFNKKITDYENTLSEIKTRLNALNTIDVPGSNNIDSASQISVSYVNEIPSFEIGSDGKPTSIPPNFQIDSHHRLNTPGIGAFAEAPAGRTYELHYDSATNLFYLGFSGDDWSDLSKFNNRYTPEEIKNSSIDGGVFFW